MPNLKSAVSERLEVFSDLVERCRALFCALFLLLIALIALGHASLRQLFYDEAVTIGAASLPRWRDVWDFYARGLDTPSPISSLVVRPFLHWPGSIEINARLPFLAAFLVSFYCVYRFLARRYPPAFALVVLLIPAYFDSVLFYAFEARAYAFMLAGFALALLCWQAAERKQSPLASLGVWLGLAIAIFSHAFAILLFLPFAAGQWLHDRQRRSIDISMWLALCLFPLGYLPALPGERRASAFYRAQFFVRPSMKFIPGLYRLHLGDSWYLLSVLFCAGLIVPAYRSWSATRHTNQSQDGLTTPEWLLLLVLAALPIYGVVAALFLGAFREPYILTFVFGFFLLAIALVAEAAGRSRKVGGVLLLLTLLGLTTNQFYVRTAVHYLIHGADAHRDLVTLVRSDPMVQVIQESSLPVVINDHVLYTALFEYAAPSLRTRLMYPIDAIDSAAYPKSSTSQTNYELFGPVFGWNTADWHPFTQEHTHFLFMRGVDSNVWLFPYLIARIGSTPTTIRLIGSTADAAYELYDVQLGK